MVAFVFVVVVAFVLAEAGSELRGFELFMAELFFLLP